MEGLSREEDWSAFLDVLAFTIYGTILFPHLDNYIDFEAIDVFFAYRDKGKNPELTVPFVIYKLSPQNVGMLRKIRQAWGNIVRKGRELGPKSHGTLGSYKAWVKSRVQQIKLPFCNAPIIIEEVPILDILRNKEIEELREALLKFEEEKRGLNRRLEEAYEKQRIALEETEQKRKSLEQMCKRTKIKEENKLRTKDCPRVERDRALVENQELKEMLRSSKIVE
ncbi:hypothetical protein CR513_42611, partial [Mucuna pruriens]